DAEALHLFPQFGRVSSANRSESEGPGLDTGSDLAAERRASWRALCRSQPPGAGTHAGRRRPAPEPVTGHHRVSRRDAPRAETAPGRPGRAGARALVVDARGGRDPSAEQPAGAE